MIKELKTAVLQAARSLGFTRAGTAPALPVPHASHFDDWLTQGRNGTMGWFAKHPETRKDIRTRYAWAKSFVVVNIEYPSELPDRLPKKSALPNIARYARGNDYHYTHKPRLKKLQDEIIRIGGPETRALWYQDTGPFLEREIAQQAGLGWVGKNTMLIDPKRGSWSFLALVVTSLDLPADAPGTDHCGNCRKCIEACPTDAFPEPYQLDATRCISYLTIEHHGAIAEPFRKPTGEWLFGCDICNEVCPWNSKSGQDPARPGKEFAELTLARIFTSKPEHLLKRIAGTPLERTGADRLKRNAAIVAGNLRDESLLPSLEQALMTEDETVQEAVVWALAQYGEAARPALARAQKHVVSDAIRDRIIDALVTGTGG
ncbi:MAG: tRNA epoxyqueuosine(34) reductase QueG [Planctomycetes bacterium]|nr:tRNA epoxyqueuosine(34) reductase QueG [Planctomycetota bacterium]